jgi:CRP-like cAMP-binding protein
LAGARRERENARVTFLTHFWTGCPDRAELQQLYQLASMVEFCPGQKIFSEGDHAASVVGVSKGCVRQYRHTPDGGRQIVAFALPGDFLGIPLAVSHSCSAEAIDQVVLCRFRRGEFARFVQSSPNTMRRLIDFTASQLDMTMRLAMLLGYASAEERLGAVHDGRIYIEKINEPFLYQLKGTPAEYKARLDRAIANGWLWLHESRTYVKFTEAGAHIRGQER